MKSIDKILDLLEKDIIDAKEAKMLINTIEKKSNSNITNEEIDNILEKNTTTNKILKGIEIFFNYIGQILAFIITYIIKGLDIVHKYLVMFFNYLLLLLEEDEETKENFDKTVDKIKKETNQVVNKVTEKTKLEVNKIKEKSSQKVEIEETKEVDNAEDLKSTVLVDPIILANNEQIEQQEREDVKELDKLEF